MSKTRMMWFVGMALLLFAVPLLGACTPQEVIKEVPVEKTVVQTQQVPVEKTVVQTKTIKPLPNIINIPARTGAATGQLSIGLAGTLTEALGVRVAIQSVPADLAMFIALKAGQGQIAIAGSSTIYNAISGVGDFAPPELGPQPLRLIFRGSPNFVILYTSKKSGIVTYADLKGKGRMVWFPASAVINQVTGYFLDAMGLSWDDVQKVNVDSAQQSIDMLKAGIVDVPAVATFPNPAILEVDATVGLHILPFTPTPEGEARFLKNRPMYGLQPVAKGSILGVDRDMKLPMSSNQLFGYDWLDEDLVYQFTKALYEVVETTPVTKEAGWAKDAGCAVPFQAPFHPGAIRFWKEVGLWGPEQEAMNQANLKALDERIAAWKTKTGS